MALNSDDLHNKSVEAQQDEYDKLHTGPNDSIPDPEAKGNHLTADELDYGGDHAKLHLPNPDAEDDNPKTDAKHSADDKK